MSGNREGGLKAIKTLKEKYGDDYYINLGKIGGRASDKAKTATKVKERYGDDFYSKIGSLGGKKSKRTKK